MPYVSNIAMNLLGHDLLQHWNTQISIPPTSEANHKLTHVSERNIRRYYYKERSLVIHIVQVQDSATVDLS